jgi:hypothetical protein
MMQLGALPPGSPRAHLDYLDSLIATPDHLYYAAKFLDKSSGEGSHNIFALRAMMFHKLRLRQLFYEPLSTFEDLVIAASYSENIWRATASLLYTDDIMVSFMIFPSSYNPPLGRLPMPSLDEKAKAVHSVSVVGVEDGGSSLVFQNSWGEHWGDRGYGRLSREYLDHFMRDAWLRRNARRGPTRFNYPRLTLVKNAQEWVSAWMSENPRWRYQLRIRGDVHWVVRYEALSIREGCPVDILELPDCYWFRLGWAEVFHLGGEERGTSVLKELFVWPWMRRRGYATLLEEEACKLARLRGSTTMRLLVHAVDGRPAVRARAQGFADYAGYKSWLWQPKSRLPSLEAVCEKAL